MLSATRICTGSDTSAGIHAESHQYGLKVDWLDCDADRFISYWLPIFDAQYGIQAPSSLDRYKPVSIKPSSPRTKRTARRRKERRTNAVQQSGVWR